MSYYKIIFLDVNDARNKKAVEWTYIGIVLLLVYVLKNLCIYHVEVLKLCYVSHPYNFNYERNSLCKHNTILRLFGLEYPRLQHADAAKQGSKNCHNWKASWLLQQANQLFSLHSGSSPSYIAFQKNI